MKFTLVVLCLVAGFAAPLAATCGIPSYSAGRVIGGTAARHGAWPWQILLLVNGRAGCGGSIIGPRHIVTASHCVVNRRTGRAMSAFSFTVRVGDNNRRYRDRGEKDYRVSRVYRHRGFSFSHFRNDVAVLELSAPIAFNDYVKPVCLPSAPVRVGTKCYITGWGRNNRNYRQMSNQLNQAPMPVVDINRCASAMRRLSPFPIGSWSLCSGYGQGRISGCQGDSGGPFVCQNGGRWELHGAVSWGSEQCSRNRNEYNVYANIYNLKSWILQYARV